MSYEALSLWHETCGEPLTPRPPLPQSIDVDVAIVGAGFTGLWTAYYLSQRDRSLRIAVLERIAKLSEPFGTKISIENNVGVIRVGAAR